jgi:hypothetical protein
LIVSLSLSVWVSAGLPVDLSTGWVERIVSAEWVQSSSLFRLLARKFLSPPVGLSADYAVVFYLAICLSDGISYLLVILSVVLRLH